MPKELDSVSLDQADKTKRRWERFKVEIRVKVTATRSGKEIVTSGTAHDISEGGMALFLAGDLIVGEAVSIDFSMPYSQRRVMRGVIRNRDRYEYGIQFVDPTPEDREDIIRNCRALALLK